jgi:hypothetical protein
MELILNGQKSSAANADFTQRWAELSPGGADAR